MLSESGEFKFGAKISCPILRRKHELVELTPQINGGMAIRVEMISLINTVS